MTEVLGGTMIMHFIFRYVWFIAQPFRFNPYLKILSVFYLNSDLTKFSYYSLLCFHAIFISKSVTSGKRDVLQATMLKIIL